MRPSLKMFLAEAEKWEKVKISIVGDELHVSYKGEGTIVWCSGGYHSDICYCTEDRSLEWLVDAISSEASLKAINISLLD